MELHPKILPPAVRWTGVIDVGGPSGMSLRAATLPLSGDVIQITGLSDDVSGRVTVYDAQVNRDGMGLMLSIDASSVVVARGQLSVKDLCEIKELCSGIACISMGAAHIGGWAVGALDVNHLAISHLRDNGHPNPVLGSVLKDSDICRMHLMNGARRSTLSAGFPCQPFSKQGDSKGMGDSRAAVFMGVARAAWLMQPGLILLECVVEAGMIPEINLTLAQLAEGLGFGIRTIELALEDLWPCRRRRWWAVITSPTWLPTSLRSWPSFSFPKVSDVIPVWPTWPAHEEDQLELNGVELHAFHEPCFGLEDRVLQTSGVAPTFLHSYGSQLSGCPCKCRSQGLSPERLERAGLRGVYVHSQMSGMPRWLHPRELAVLQTVMPDMIFNDDLRASLVMLGQIAAPAQALWLLAQIWCPLLTDLPSPEKALKSYLDELLRRRYHVFPPQAIPDRQLTHVWSDLGSELIASTGVHKVEDFLAAECRALSCTEVSLVDDGARLHGLAVLHSSGQTGAYTIARTEASNLVAPAKLVLVKLISEGMTWQTLLYSGSFLFEAFWRLRLQVEPTKLYDGHDGCWFPDSRVWEDVTLMDVPVLTSAGPLDTGVLYQQPQDDITGPQLQRAIDGLALRPSGPDEFLLSVAHAQVLVQAPLHLPSAVLHRCGQCLVFHGVFHSCGHWAMFSCIRAAGKVEVHYFDGVIHLLDHEMRAVGAWASRLWHLDQVEVIFARTVVQPQPHLSAAVALAHLRQVCSLLSAPTSADLEQWHEWLMAPLQEDASSMEVDVIPAAEGVDLLAMARFADHLMTEATGEVTLMPVLYSVALGHGNEEEATAFLQRQLPLTKSVALLVESAHHWLLLVIHDSMGWIDVDYYDGLPHAHDQVVTSIARWAQELLMARGFVINYVTALTQQQHDHCGVIALAHLAMILRPEEDWTQSALTDLHSLLQDSWEVSHSVWACGPDGSEQRLVQEVADLLISKGVPKERASERALAGISAVGEAAMVKAMRQKHPWAELKQLGSMPSVRFQWVKADELMKQVRARAEENYGVSAATRKRDNRQERAEPQPLQIHPSQLSLIDGSFVDSEGKAMQQIQLADVTSQATGVAFATVAEAGPYLKEGKSLSLSPLALLTTSQIPHDLIGLLPVDHMRYPVLYQGTQEPVLVQGSLIQLGDENVSRHHDSNPPNLDALPTATLRLLIFRDEFEQSGGNWASFCQGPLRQMFQVIPGLTICRGEACGGDCSRHHCPVDQDYESLLTDIWERRWSRTDGGGRVKPEDAGQFSVLARVVKSAAEQVQNLSGQRGFYVEPRQEDGKGPAAGYGVIWLNQHSLRDAEHKRKTVDGAVALVRLGQRWGLRFKDGDMATAFAELRPHETYMKVQVQEIYLMHPLPHGTTRAGLVKCLKSWGWAAKPLQPVRGGPEGAGWHVGSGSPPPSAVLQGAHGDVVVTKVRSVVNTKEAPSILGSFKTKAHLRSQSKTPLPTKVSSNASASKDPWLQQDPWQSFKPTQPRSTGPDITAPAKQKLEEVEKKLRDDMKSVVRKELEDHAACSEDAAMQNSWDADVRLCRLESSLGEIKAQNARYDQWFEHQAQVQIELNGRVEYLAQDLQSQKQQVEALDQAVHKQGNDTQSSFVSLAEDMRKGFAHIESMFATHAQDKRQRKVSESPHKGE